MRQRFQWSCCPAIALKSQGHFAASSTTASRSSISACCHQNKPTRRSLDKTPLINQIYSATSALADRLFDSCSQGVSDYYGGNGRIVRPLSAASAHRQLLKRALGLCYSSQHD